jgi:hypothetical protein
MNGLQVVLSGQRRGPRGLVGDPSRALARLRDFVRERGLPASVLSWVEVDCSLRDGATFLDFSARISAGRPRVLIEFGTDEPQLRCTVAVFEAEWDMATADFGRIETVLVCGAAASVAEFEQEVQEALTMAKVGRDVVMKDRLQS